MCLFVHFLLHYVPVILCLSMMSPQCVSVCQYIWYLIMCLCVSPFVNSQSIFNMLPNLICLAVCQYIDLLHHYACACVFVHPLTHGVSLLKWWPRRLFQSGPPSKLRSKKKYMRVEKPIGPQSSTILVVGHFSVGCRMSFLL